MEWKESISHEKSHIVYGKKPVLYKKIAEEQFLGKRSTCNEKKPRLNEKSPTFQSKSPKSCRSRPT